jgi:hypothetical protein
MFRHPELMFQRAAWRPLLPTPGAPRDCAQHRGANNPDSRRTQLRPSANFMTFCVSRARFKRHRQPFRFDQRLIHQEEPRPVQSRKQPTSNRSAAKSTQRQIHFTPIGFRSHATGFDCCKPRSPAFVANHNAVRLLKPTPAVGFFTTNFTQRRLQYTPVRFHSRATVFGFCKNSLNFQILQDARLHEPPSSIPTNPASIPSEMHKDQPAFLGRQILRSLARAYVFPQELQETR